MTKQNRGGRAAKARYIVVAWCDHHAEAEPYAELSTAYGNARGRLAADHPNVILLDTKSSAVLFDSNALWRAFPAPDEEPQPERILIARKRLTGL